MRACHGCARPIVSGRYCAPPRRKSKTPAERAEDEFNELDELATRRRANGA